MKSSRINICSVLFQIKKSFKNWDAVSNQLKILLLKEILQKMNKKTDLLLLPAGFLNSQNKSPNSILKASEKKITKLIMDFSFKLNICFGVDGKNKLDQLAVLVDRKGIKSMARKFYHEKGVRNLAKSAFEKEKGFDRFFKVKGKVMYVAVCWDIKGIYKKDLPNNGFDIILNVVHGFDNSRDKGDVDFARKCLAGAAKQWSKHVYASAVFAENRQFNNWPAGIKWTYGNKSIKNCKYNDIKIESVDELLNTKFSKILLKYYQE
jgi:hypothetical protein